MVQKNIFLHRRLRIHRFDIFMAVAYLDNGFMAWWYVVC